MALNHAVGYFTNGSTPSTVDIFGPYTTGACTKILRAKIRAQHTVQSQILTQPFTFVEVLVYGVQVGPTGYTPADVVAAPSDPAFLDVKHDEQSIGSVVWSPSTADSVYGNVVGATLDFNGQKPNGGGAVDFYFSFGSQFGGPATWLWSGSIDLWWVSP